MCSAYFLKRVQRQAERAAQSLLDRLAAEARDRDLPLIRPTDPAPVIVQRGADGPQLESARWGLVPHWAKDTTIARQTFNARAETIAEKPAFRDSFRKSRCLVPASGWFEWTGEKKAKIRHAVMAPDDAGLLFAGLFAIWKRPDGEWLPTFTIVTVDAIDSLGQLHTRMPHTLSPDHAALWLEGTPDDAMHLLAANDLEYVIEPPVPGPTLL